MRLMIAVAAAALAGSVLMTTPVLAQQGSAVVVAEPSARQLDLTRTYINLMMSDQLEDSIRELIGDQMGNDTAMQGLPAEDQRFIVNLSAEMTADMLPQMIEEMAPVYAAVFTEEELLALIAFYDTGIGRSIADKTVMVMPEANRAAMSVVPQMLEKMALRMCQYYSCTPAELEEVRRGMREESGLDANTTSAPRTK